ncbi:MAG: hypothetical protein OES47_03185 [Acidobacteriota bacterium]|nr:hypothetical protein [Acidobacteriota bacterium]
MKRNPSVLLGLSAAGLLLPHIAMLVLARGLLRLPTWFGVSGLQLIVALLLLGIVPLFFAVLLALRRRHGRWRAAVVALLVSAVALVASYRLGESWYVEFFDQGGSDRRHCKQPLSPAVPVSSESVRRT